MKLSILTTAKDAIRLDFHLVHMLKHHLGLADEIIVAEGYSTDRTYECIRNIHPKIKIIRRHWDATDSYSDFVNFGSKQATGDWCIKLDADEFIPEWEWGRLRTYLEKSSYSLIPLKLRNFYGNYQVEHVNPGALRWPEYKWCIYPNRPGIKFFGDASSCRIVGRDAGYGRSQEPFEAHHFGMVRNPARLREKWRNQAIRNQRFAGKYKERNKIIPIPGWLFDIFPHNWLKEDIIKDLQIYRGPYLKIVEDNPKEFVRDNFMLLRKLMRG